MKFLKYLLWLIFPSRCICCNKVIKRNCYICDFCNSHIEKINKICTQCGCEKSACECRRKVFRFVGAVAPFHNGEYSKSAVYNFKFNGNIEAADFLANSMANCVKEHWDDINFTAITYVPALNRSKFADRYNQSEILAKKISCILNIPCINCIKKVKQNKAQHTMKMDNRETNVKGVFSACDITAENILLVDDIKTTGATLDECTKELMFAGAQKVYCVTAISNIYKKQQLKKNKI